MLWRISATDAKIVAANGCHTQADRTRDHPGVMPPRETISRKRIGNIPAQFCMTALNCIQLVSGPQEC
jgi:hypothetical protein